MPRRQRTSSDCWTEPASGDDLHRPAVQRLDGRSRRSPTRSPTSSDRQRLARPGRLGGVPAGLGSAPARLHRRRDLRLHESRELPLVWRVLAEEGGHWSDTLVWVKDRFVPGRADYQRSYEPIWYGWREGAGHHWCGDRDQDDVWEISRPAEAPLHPTMKPLALMERAIANSSVAGDLVADFFAGSGSTLIACERTGRRCAALELAPVYIDVILARWEAFSGQSAEPVNG